MQVDGMNQGEVFRPIPAHDRDELRSSRAQPFAICGHEQRNALVMGHVDGRPQRHLPLAFGEHTESVLQCLEQLRDIQYLFYVFTRQYQHGFASILLWIRPIAQGGARSKRQIDEFRLSLKSRGAAEDSVAAARLAELHNSTTAFSRGYVLTPLRGWSRRSSPGSIYPVLRRLYFAEPRSNGIVEA